MTEFFDIYDEGLNHIGKKARAAVHRDGDWHQVFHCWVIGRDANGSEFVILQKRGMSQDTFPGKLDISAAGHLEAGESVRDGVRVIEEELGLQVNFDDLVPLGRRIGITKFGDLVDRQICHVFIYESNLQLADYNYSRTELCGLLKLPLDAGIRLLSGELAFVQAEARGLNANPFQITTNDFIPSIDNYMLKTLVLARRYFAGEDQLWI